MVSWPRRAGLGAALAWLAGGCAAPNPAAGPVKGTTVARGAELLTPWLTLTGGWRAPTPAAALLQGLPNAARLNFVWPVALAARDDAVIVADAGLRQLVRVDRNLDRATPLGALAPDRGVALHWGPDLGLWMAEPSSGLLRLLDRNGREVRRFSHDLLAARPVAVAWRAQEGGGLFVADAQAAQVVVFDVFGRALRRFGQGRLQSVVAMASGPKGLYLLDRQAQQVLVFDEQGTLLETMGADTLVLPQAIAVDRSGRVFVADEADAAIHVFRQGRAVARLTGRALGLSRIDALAVDGHLLHAADSMASRVRILLITPDSMRPPEPD